MTRKRDDRGRYGRLEDWLDDHHPQGGLFGLLLLVLISAYVISAFAPDTVTSATQIVLFLVASSLAVRNGRVARRTARLVIAVAVGGSVVAVTLVLTHPDDAGGGAANLWAALVLLLAPRGGPARRIPLPVPHLAPCTASAKITTTPRVMMPSRAGGGGREVNDHAPTGLVKCPG